MSSFEQEARREATQQEVFKGWVRARVENIHASVSAHDVLRRQGVTLKQTGSEREEQFSCPFHGKDTKPSAKVYPAGARSPSHAWCFVCQERWDVITLWKKFEAFEGKFTRLLSDIEQAFGLLPPDKPLQENEIDDSEQIAFELLLDLCERRLKGAKRAFDMRGYLLAGQILDRVVYRVEKKALTYIEAKKILDKLLVRIALRERIAPEDEITNGRDGMD